MRAAIYARVSTHDQADSGTSLQTQVEAARALAAGRDYEVIEQYVIRDDASGTVLDRPGLHRVSEGAAAGAFDVLIAYTLDRVYRPKEAGDEWRVFAVLDQLRQSGVSVEFVDPTIPTSGTFASVINFLRAWQAGEERRAILDRSMRGKRAKAANGSIPQGTGKGIYGYLYDPRTKRREVNDLQAAVVRRMFQMAADRTTAHGITTTLNREGIPTLTGRDWHARTIGNMIGNPSYKGEMIYGRTKRLSKSKTVEQPRSSWIVIPDACPPIVSPEMWTAAQLGLEAAKPVRRQSARYLLTGYAVCGECNAPMHGQSMQRGRYHYYHCGRQARTATNPEPCPSRSHRAEPLDARVWEFVSQVLTDPGIVLREIQKRESEVIPVLEEERAALDTKLQETREREQRMVRLYEVGQIDEGMIARRVAQLRTERTTVQTEIADLERQIADATRLRKMQPHLEEVIAGVAGKLEEADYEHKRLAFEALQLKVKVSADGSIDISGAVPTEMPSNVSHHCTNMGITTWI